ncbi:hypothetical protein PC121_g575 [Phytophthora cactorum]|nr:hypothetical protein PC120_g696 [Phytophthora cactorum]KAG3104843.1 hypothetical protein PC121_g575 [Phytophthora cactorum]KAG4063805.1 hypothetical protein PC123_g1391 [Phytophthora cactorum]
MDRCNYMDESTANTEGYADTEVVGSLSLPLAQQDLQVESRADTPLEQPASAGHARKNFTAAADAILLRAVNVGKPWEAAKGTANGVMKSFDKVANICEEVEGFVRKHGSALRTRFDKIVRQYRDAEVVSRRASGTIEEYDERDMLLQDIITRMDDFQQLQAAEKHLRRAKDDGIEASGALMRRLAMGELEDELQGDTASADDEPKEEDDAGRVAIMQAPPARVLKSVLLSTATDGLQR